MDRSASSIDPSVTCYQGISPYRNGRSDLVDVDGKLIHETEKAYLIDVGQLFRHWVPKSVCEYDEDAGTFTMPEAIAKEKGLI